MNFTAENLPKCAKCGENALTRLECDMWFCGECLHKKLQSIKEKQREMYLKE